jgi:hypothetical protein
MQVPQDRLTSLMDQIAQQQRLGDKIKCQITGPHLVLVPDGTGQPQIQMGWQFTLWLETKLIGQDPVGVSFAVGLAMLGGAMVPPQIVLERLVPQMLDKAREIRHEQENPAPAGTPNADEMLAAMRAQNGQQ